MIGREMTDEPKVQPEADMTAPVVTIDGPSGSGKGTLAAGLARRLGWQVLDSGAIYRMTALWAEQNDIDLQNLAAVANLASGMDASFVPGKTGQPLRVMLGGRDVTNELRTERVGAMASTIAVHPQIRLALLERQRAFRQLPGLVADGRDMGTVVFPQASLKFYVTASAEVRARRRYEQLKAQGEIVRLPHLLREIQQRDDRDTQREAAPLLPADDAVIIDTSDLPALQVLDYVVDLVEKSLSIDS